MKTETGRKKRRCCFQIAFRLGLQYRLLSESPVCQPTLQNLDMLAYMITWSLKCIYTHIYICVCIDPPTHTHNLLALPLQQVGEGNIWFHFDLCILKHLKHWDLAITCCHKIDPSTLFWKLLYSQVEASKIHSFLCCSSPTY